MTIDELLKTIAEKSAPGEWRLYGERIRHVDEDDDKSYCPICWVAKKLEKNPNKHGLVWWRVNDDLGLDEQDAVMVVDAADNNGKYPELRQRLLAACGLS